MKPKDDLEKGIKATAKSLVDFSLQKCSRASRGLLSVLQHPFCHYFRCLSRKS